MSHEIGRILILKISPRVRFRASGGIFSGCTYPSEKYDFVNWDDDDLPIYGKIKVMFQSPPTSFGVFMVGTVSRPPPSIQRQVTDMKEEICFTNLSTFDS